MCYAARGCCAIARVRRGTEVEQPAAAVLTSVRESLGMNHSLELMNLRTRVDELELLLRRQREGDLVAERTRH